MDVDMTMQILDSPEKIDVLYENSPVWILSVKGNKAKVRFLETGKESEVPVSGLVNMH